MKDIIYQRCTGRVIPKQKRTKEKKDNKKDKVASSHQPFVVLLSQLT